MVGANRARKLFGLVPIQLLSRPAHTGSVGRVELVERADEFAQGGWGDLLTKARENVHDFLATVKTPEDDVPSGERASVKSEA